MGALSAALESVGRGGRRAMETPLCLVAVAGAAVAQLGYEKLRPEKLPAAADWLVTAAVLAAFLAVVLRLLARPAPSLGRALGAYAAAQLASTLTLTLIFLAARASFLSFLAPLVPAAFSAFAAVAALSGLPAARARWREALLLGALYAAVALLFALLLRSLSGGLAALPATAFFAFMGLFAAAAPAALEDR